MLPNFVEYFWLGFAITAIPGAVFFETIRRCLSDTESVRGFLTGNFTGMALIILSSFLGLGFINNNSLTRIFYSLSGVVLIYLGISAILQNPKVSKVNHHKYSSFYTGLFLAVANPLSIIFWISLTGNFLQSSNGFIEPILYSAGVMAGALALCILLIVIVNRFESFINDRYIKIISVIFGLIITAYGLLILSKVFG
jgi:threonine/homoserine/homoserine lactone efflux protein